MNRRITLVALILSIAVIAPACGNDSPPVPAAAEAGAALDGDFSGTGPGTLRTANTLPNIDRRLRAITSTAGRVEYISTSAITTAETRVTGTVFAPKGPPPEGGWPVIAVGHASSILESDCAPSLSPSLLGLAPIMTLLVRSGFVVTVPDYQGLGSDQGSHHYLEPITAGYNIIDSVRAARKLVPDTSDRWVALGISQGGQAAWAANEVAGTYGTGLTLLGSVSLAPPLQLTFLADAAASGELSDVQEPGYQLVLASLENAYPEFNLGDYRRGIVEQDWSMLLQCDGTNVDTRAGVIDEIKAVEQITADDLRPSSQAATDVLRGHVQRWSLPQARAAAPMLVIYGGQDALIPAETTDRALAEACRLGDVIDIQKQPEKGHNDLDIATALPWITERFDGAPVVDSCTAARQPDASEEVE